MLSFFKGIAKGVAGLPAVPHDHRKVTPQQQLHQLAADWEYIHKKFFRLTPQRIKDEDEDEEGEGESSPFGVSP